MRRSMSGNGGWQSAVLVSLLLGTAMVGAVWNGGGEAPSGRTPCPFQPSSAGGFAQGVASVNPPQVLNPCPGGEWAKTYGTPNYDVSLAVIDTADGGFALLVSTFTVAVTLVKYDANGSLEWQRSFDRGTNFQGSLRQTSDGGYALALRSYNWAIVYKLDASGVIEWQRFYDGMPRFIAEAPAGGYFVGGAIGTSDAWVIRLDSTGSVLWERRFAGASGGEDVAATGVATADGGFAFAGWIRVSNDYEAWLVRLDSAGSVLWQISYDTASADVFHSLRATPDGGFIAGGASAGKTLVMKLTAIGGVTWQKVYGFMPMTSILPTSDGGFLVSGRAQLGGGGNPNNQIGALKLSATGTILWARTYGGSAYEQSCAPDCVAEVDDGTFLIAGQTDSYGAGDEDAWLLRVMPGSGDIDPSCPAGLVASASPSSSGGKLKVTNPAYGQEALAGNSSLGNATASAGSLAISTQCSA